MWSIKQRFIRWKLKRAAQANIKRETVPFDQVRTVGILFVDEGSVSAGKITVFAERLREQGKQVKVLGFMAKPPKEEVKNRFSAKDFSLTGTLTDPGDFVEKKFDHLLYFGPSPELPLQHVLLHSQARCRMGAYHEEHTECFEFMVKGPSPAQWDDIFNTITAYSQKLRTAS